MPLGESTTLLMEAPAGSGERTSLIRPRGRPRKDISDIQPKTPKLFNKIIEAVNNHPGQPLLYGSTTKGTMKLVFDGHHFRYSFRKGKYTIFQCCYKENKEECTVRVVTDQKLVYPLDGEHIHFVAATDKSVTSIKFTPGEDLEMQYTVDQQQQTQSQYIIDDLVFIEEAIPQPMIKDVKLEKISSQDSLEFTSEAPKTVSGEDQPDAADNANEFREKIKKRLQKALLVMQHVRNCGPQLFIISRKGGTLLAINDFVYRSNLRRFGPLGDKVYWECIHNRSKKCRSRLKTVGDDLYVTNDVHNHSGDGQRIELARRSGMLIYKKFSAIGLLPNKPSFQ